MIHMLTEVAKYVTILLVLIYTMTCFSVFQYSTGTQKQKGLYGLQRTLTLAIHAISFFILFLNADERMKMFGFYLMQFILLVAIYLLYTRFYPSVCQVLLNNMCILLALGMIILTRLSYEKAFRQFIFIFAGFAVGMFIPMILQKESIFRKFTWLYAGVGIIALATVAVAGTTSYGAKLSLSFAGISIQPSEFIKIIFVFFIASMLYQTQTTAQLFKTSCVSAVFVLILVASKDLGGALLFFFTYLVMIYVASGKWYYFAGGLGLMGLASVVGYKLFSHVQVRVSAWMDPVSVIDGSGYQVSQSLFAIGTGGWFGLGLGQGLPKKIPVVEKDFIFSAISEEMGAIVAICLIIICMSCFLLIFNISMQLKDAFYRLVALGLGTTYSLQVFLMIGGVTKFIPSTGVTLPLVSYGGSSLLATMILFGIIQAFYILREEEPKPQTAPLQEEWMPREEDINDGEY